MKTRTKIQQDLKRGFGSAPTGIEKNGEVAGGRLHSFKK